MAAIVWTKSWSASDDGSPFGGADIQNIQNNITDQVNGNLTPANFAATMTFSDGDYIDLSTILHDDTSLQGLRLPQIGASPSNPTSGEGQIGWDQTNNTLEVYDGSAWSGVPKDISARVFNSVNISIADVTLTFLTFDSESFDTDAIHSTVSNTGLLTATTAGKYLIGGCVYFEDNATGRRDLTIRRNGSNDIVRTTVLSSGAADGTKLEVTTYFNLAAGDYVELGVFQASGGALNVSRVADFSPEFWMVKVP